MTEVSETNLQDQSLEKRLSRVEKQLSSLMEKINLVSKLEEKTKHQLLLLNEIEKLVIRNEKLKSCYYYWDDEEDIKILKLMVIVHHKNLSDEKEVLKEVNTIQMSYHPEFQVHVRSLTMSQMDAENYFKQSEYKILVKKDE